MSDITRLFQQQVPLDSKVKIFLTTGKEAIGILDEISRGHVTLHNNGKPVTILLNMIGGWEVLEDTELQTNLSGKESRDEINTTQGVPEKNAEDVHAEQETPEVIAALSAQSDPSSSDDKLNLQIYTKFVEINAHFQARLLTAKIEITPPDFLFPTEELQPVIPQVRASKLWDRLVNKYNYALKINELGIAHGRLPNIIHGLEELSHWYPRSSHVSNHLAYFYHLASQQQKALETYKKVIINSEREHGWHNLAAIAMESKQEELACYSLEQFFRQSSITKIPDGWYLFIRFLLKFSNYFALKPLSIIVLDRNHEQELEIFFNTIVFLLKSVNKEDIAQEIIRGQLENYTYETLFLHALEHFENQPVEAYQKFLSESDIISNFSIRLSSENDFEEIHNPYAPYAESGIVEDERMFYGREELIQNIARAIQNAKTKSVVIYGQKRAGKSSILHHLKKKLQTDKSLLVLDWGNIGSIRDQSSQTPLLYQILWGILEQLQFTIEDKIDEGFPSLELALPPCSLEFYSHPDPITYFKEIFQRYKRKTSKSSDWRNVRIVLLIDEFTYIFDWILNGEISASFMKNWKALLQENYFSAVLVGQDYMPKFKLRFPNEFGTTQDERVTYLRQEDAIRLIDEPIRIGGRQGKSRYREQAIETIFALTAGSPFYIQIVCNRLVEYMNRKRAKFVTEADVKQVQNDLITGNNALDIGKFDNLINSGDTSADAISDEEALKILTTIALNSPTGLCNRSNIACETRILVDEILRDLVNREVVEQRDQNYRIRVELFKEWLVAHPVR